MVESRDVCFVVAASWTNESDVQKYLYQPGNRLDSSASKHTSELLPRFR